ncbi:MAG: sterol desaturase family protein [Pseudomonadota bacterium]
MRDFLANYLTGLGSTLAILGLVYVAVWWLFHRWVARRKVQLSRRAGWTQIREEIWHGAVAALGSSALVVSLFWLRDHGWLKLEAETGVHGLWYEAVTIVALVLVADAWFYWLHRWMHHPRVYRYVHALHHKSLDVNPFTSNSFHVIEAVGLTLFIVPVLMLMPVSAFALGVVQAMGLFNNVKSHLGYEFYPRFFRHAPFRWLITATNHSLHHTQYNGNYGLYFRFWDWLCGTELKATDRLFDDIHARKGRETVVVDNAQYRPLLIDRLERETADVVSVYFRPEDPQFHRYKAGQHLTVRVKVGGRTHMRCFSLSSAPGVDDFLRITVKLNGPVSHYFYYDARSGDTVQALYPTGDFALDPSADHHVMIAGGSGVTPFLSMIRTRLAQNEDARITLLYASHPADRVLFADALDQLAARHRNFTWTPFISGQARIGRENLAPYRDATFYVCGPEGLKATVTRHLDALGVSRARVETEHCAEGYVPLFGALANRERTDRPKQTDVESPTAKRAA